MALDSENIFREYEELRLLNQQLKAQVVVLQNNLHKWRVIPRVIGLPISTPSLEDQNLSLVIYRLLSEPTNKSL